MKLFNEKQKVCTILIYLSLHNFRIVVPLPMVFGNKKRLVFGNTKRLPIVFFSHFSLSELSIITTSLKRKRFVFILKRIFVNSVCSYDFKRICVTLNISFVFSLMFNYYLQFERWHSSIHGATAKICLNFWK